MTSAGNLFRPLQKLDRLPELTRPAIWYVKKQRVRDAGYPAVKGDGSYLQKATPAEEEETDLLTETGRAVGDATKFVGGAAFGGVGLVTDTLGITKNAEETRWVVDCFDTLKPLTDKLAATAEDAVDLVGSGVSSVVGAVDQVTIGDPEAATTNKKSRLDDCRTCMQNADIAPDGAEFNLRWRCWPLFVLLATLSSASANYVGIEQEVAEMQVTLLQAKLQLGKAMVETDKSYVGSKKTATTSDFLHGVHELERRIASLESRLDNLATTSTPWFLQPFDSLVSISRKFGDFVGDLVLHPRSFAWQQFGVFCLCLAGVMAGGLQFQQHRYLSEKTGGASATVLGFAISMASVFIAGAICHPLIPWLLLLLWCWILRATRPIP
ncbi:unnamed protein product [Symbiodinium natans]|uniref:Uncharacterized protein n=1 Tax=Symbiodinium natans TaxID=878477 RepID=A0A812GBW4_9DINO|nr:unnamed protein product [Symbiodinium natans]